ESAVDGDTLKLADGNTVRILGINSPEKGQHYYNEAKVKMAQLVGGRVIELERDADAKDQYGRQLRHGFIDGNVNIAIEMLKGGFAIVYNYGNGKARYMEEYATAERSAQSARRGIWAKGGQDACTSCITLVSLQADAAGDECENSNDEYATFRNACTINCNLQGWNVRDNSSSHMYTFTDFNVAAGAAFSLRSGCGTNTPSDIYWCGSQGSCNAVWNNDSDRLIMANKGNEIVIDYPYAK
ncbi:MAG TPA: hypothetical protein HA254_02105, partial [Candidatus Diapherotrites archaeon]|nr:hypothetical protein [Candidatus Diapherotrites archaeon]